jgi:hypothetical protein
MSEPAIDLNGAEVPAAQLKPGDRYAGPGGVPVEIARERQPWTDRFGRDMYKYWARRTDTGAEGWVLFGPAGVVRALEPAPPAAPERVSIPGPIVRDPEPVSIDSDDFDATCGPVPLPHRMNRP